MAHAAQPASLGAAAEASADDQQQILLGDEAVARGAIDAGISAAYASAAASGQAPGAQPGGSALGRAACAQWRQLGARSAALQPLTASTFWAWPV